MDGRMGGWGDDGKKDESRMDGWPDDGSKDGWSDGWMGIGDRWMDDWMGGTPPRCSGGQ